MEPEIRPCLGWIAQQKSIGNAKKLDAVEIEPYRRVRSKYSIVVLVFLNQRCRFSSGNVRLAKHTCRHCLREQGDTHDPFRRHALVLVVVLSTIVIEVVTAKEYLDVPLDLISGPKRSVGYSRLKVCRLYDLVACC